MATDTRFIKVDGGFERPDATGTSGRQLALSDLGNVKYGGTSSAPGSDLPQETQPDQDTSDPALSAYINLSSKLYEKAKGVDTLALQKKVRDLQIKQNESSRLKPEEVGTLSPEQQSAIESSRASTFDPQINEANYELGKAKKQIDNFESVYEKMLTVSKDYAEKLAAPDSVIDAYVKTIEADPKNLSTIIAKVNDKTRDKIVQNLDYGKLGTGTASTGAYVVGADPTADAWVQRIQDGQAKITEIPASQAALRNQVTKGLAAGGNSASGKPTVTELGKAALKTAKELLTKFDAGTGTSAVGKSRFWGLGGLTSMIPGSEGSNLTIDFNSLKSQLALEAVKYLKGQGAVSDAERALLSQAVTKLSLSQSEEEFKKTLQDVIAKLEGTDETADTATGTTDTEETKTVDGVQYKKVPGGWQKVSFSNVGADTQNRPQSNNNPGNLKTGGIADKYAVGTDDQGHLIFPDGDTGKKALAADLQAKISGGSRYLMPNPTIAQLGKVYAEDPNWGNSVARILGVSPTTKTSTVDFNALLNAVMRQEGYFA